MNIVEWRDALLESPLNYKAKFIGIVLSQFYRRGNSTYPSIRTLSKLSGLTINPVQDGLQILISANFISRKKERLCGDRYLSNIYTFNNVIEIQHVSPRDVSPGDTSGGDTSNDTSNDTSRGDTKEEEKKDKVERGTLTKNFKDLIFQEKWERGNLEGLALQNCWDKWKIHYSPSGPVEEWRKSWGKWVLNERKGQISGMAKELDEKPLEGEDLHIQYLGSAAWRRKEKMSLNLEQVRLLENYEVKNGFVWWDNLRQFKKGKKELKK